VRIVDIEVAGAPLRRRFVRRGRCERTVTRMVGGTPAQRCISTCEKERRKKNDGIEKR
jgi:hypothetical protein